MTQPATSTSEIQNQNKEEQITLPRETFKQRLKQAERAGVRAFLAEAGLTEETTADQVKQLLQQARDVEDGKSAAALEEAQNRIASLETEIETMQAENQAQLEQEQQKRREVIVREALLRAYLENNGLPAEINPRAQETALREMITMPGVSFNVDEDNSVTVVVDDGDDQQKTSLSEWVAAYLEKRQYLLRNSNPAAGIGNLDTSLDTFNPGEIRSSASDRNRRLELGKSL
jgi:hypothetical protein